jgi:hypothetical protein
MSLWDLIQNTIREAIDTVLEGLEPYEYATLPTKTSARLLSFKRNEEWTYSVSLTVFELDQSPPFHALSYTWDTLHQFPLLGEPESSSTNLGRFTHWCNAYSRPMSFKCNGKKIVVRPGRNLANVFKRL